MSSVALAVESHEQAREHIESFARYVLRQLQEVGFCISNDPMPSAAWMASVESGLLRIVLVDGSITDSKDEEYPWHEAIGALKGVFLRQVFSRMKADYCIHMHECVVQEEHYDGKEASNYDCLVVVCEGRGWSKVWECPLDAQRNPLEPKETELSGNLSNVSGTMGPDDCLAARIYREIPNGATLVVNAIAAEA